MIRKFTIHSKHLESDITLTFNAHGLMIGIQFSNEEIKDESDIKRRIAALNKTLPEFQEWSKKADIKPVELQPDLSFDRFWDVYNYKEGGSKKKTRDIWERMSDKQKVLALSHLPKYENHIKLRGIAKQYASSYLNAQAWQQ